MEVFRYKAIDEKGRVLHGKVDAANAADLETRLSRIGLDLVNYRELKSKHKNVTGRGIKRSDMITFCFHLEHLLRAGVPILEGLSDLRDTIDNKRLREITAAMIESIEGGKNLSGAMRDFPFVFSPVFVSLIRAGEQSGQLVEVLQKLIENLKWQDEQAAQTKKLLMYPSIVSAIVAAVLFFLMLHVVPQLISFLSTMGQELPLSTRVLIGLSEWTQSYWWLLLAVVVGAVAGVRWLLAQPNIRLAWDRQKLSMPFVSRITRSSNAARYANTLSILTSSGVPLVEAMNIAAEVVSNKWLQRRLGDATQRVSEGSSLRVALEGVGYFPPMLLHMVASGESSGELDVMLDKVARYQQTEVERIVTTLVRLFEPMMLVIMGGLVMFIVMAILLPILTMNQLV